MINFLKEKFKKREGYLRLSSKKFEINNFNKYIHLTNNAIQKYSNEYNKYEKGNILSFQDFQVQNI